MRLERGHTYGLLVLFVAIWATLAMAGSTIDKADLDTGSEESAIELGLKVCATLFTAVVAAVGAFPTLWRRLPVFRSGFERRSPVRFRRRYRPPPHGFSLLRRLQIIIV